MKHATPANPSARWRLSPKPMKTPRGTARAARREAGDRAPVGPSRIPRRSLSLYPIDRNVIEGKAFYPVSEVRGVQRHAVTL